MWLTRKEAAAYLKITTKTLDRWTAAGIVPVYKSQVPSGKARSIVRYRLADLDHFLEKEDVR